MPPIKRLKANQTQQISAQLRKSHAKWIKQQCTELGLNRNQYFDLLFSGLIAMHKDMTQQGTLFNIFSKQLETALESSLKKQHKRS